MGILRNSVMGVALAATLSLAASSAKAQSTTILNYGGTPAKVTWSNTLGTNGRLIAGTVATPGTLVDVTAPPSIAESGVSWTFSADFVAGSSAWLVNTSTVKIKAAQFNNGSFSFTGVGGNILSGTFTQGTLVSNNGALSFSVGGNNVTYTGGTALTGYTSPWIGDLAFGISGHTLGISGWGHSAGNITTSTFNGATSGTMDLMQSGVPEPGEWAAMGILASGLTGLMVRARRRK